MKGKYTPFGYLEVADGRLMEFATEKEYLEYMEDNDNDEYYGQDGDTS